jgi:hypothetical protein
LNHEARKDRKAFPFFFVFFAFFLEMRGILACRSEKSKILTGFDNTLLGKSQFAARRFRSGAFVANRMARRNQDRCDSCLWDGSTVAGNRGMAWKGRADERPIETA